MEDDGKSKDKNDLSGISKRLIKKITPHKDANLFGFTKTLEEKYLHPATKEEILLRREDIFYFPDGKIKRKDIFDAKNSLRYSLNYTYDPKGNLETETDPLGRKAIYKYDENGNRIYEKDFSDKTSFFEYDQNNRLIKKTLKVNNLDYVTQYGYDVNNNLVLETDPRGNVAHFKYDAFGNIIEKRLPSLLDEDGSVVQKIFKYEYDELGRCIKEILPNSEIVIKRYNFYGNITYIKHQDNSEESFIYNKNGTLKKHVNQMGTSTEYEYDYQKRIISKKIISSKKEKLFEEHFKYGTFNLISHTDNEGNETVFRYDNAGRKIHEEKKSSNNTIISKEQFFYNEMGFLDKIIYGNALIVQYEKDLLDRILEERRSNLKNQLLYKIGYRYDKTNNLSCIKTYVNNTEQKKEFFYDELDRLIKTIDPLKNIEKIEYNDFYINDLSQKVLKKTVVNAIGQRTVITHDAIGREIKIEEMNPKEVNDNILSLEEKFYDISDNLRVQKSTVYNPDRSFKNILTSWEYDNMGRLIKLTEAKGSNIEKETFYTYSKNGQLIKTIKPDGTLIENSYDELGNNIEIKSSDFSIHYLFQYDALNRCISVQDLINDENIARKYDMIGNLLEEKLTNNFIISHKYDLLGNRTKTVYPDKSSVHYLYNPVNLTMVIRVDKNENRYEHIFDKYDLDGNLLEEIPVNKNRVKFQIDELSRIVSIDAKGFKQKIKGYDNIGRIKGMKTETSSYKNDTDFSYDELNQLTHESGLFQNDYGYDSHNNRLLKNEEIYTVNDLNELLDTSIEQFEYDKNGRPFLKRSKTGETFFVYDALDRLVRVEEKNKFIIYFGYDGFNRRVKKTVKKHVQSLFSDRWETVNESYIHDDQNEIGSIDESGDIKTLRILSDSSNAEIGSAISFEINEKVYTPIYDFQGNVVILQDMNRKEIESYGYSAFGEKKIYDERAYEISSSKINNPWQYLSKRLDEETNLVFFGRRYYDPEIGRWLTPDPKGFVNGLNLYAYVLNDPLIKLDLYGLEIDDFPRMDFSKSNMNLFLNFNIEFNSYWKYLLLMKIQNLSFHSNKNLDLFGSSYYRILNSRVMGVDWSINFYKGIFEVFTGIELTDPLTRMGTQGRIFGRNIAKMYADVSLIMGLCMTATGTFTSGASPIFAMAGGHIVIAAVESASITLVAGGLAATAQGLILQRNYDKLGKLEVSKNKNISVNQIKELIQKGKAPKSIERIDKAKIANEIDHIHFKQGFSINRDGTFKHKPKSGTKLTNKEINFLKKINFKIPEELL